MKEVEVTVAEVVRKKVGLELGSKKNWGQGFLESEGGAWPHPHLQPGEYVYHFIRSQRIQDAVIIILYDLQSRISILVGGVEANQADYVGHRQEERQGQIYGLSILGGQEITQ